MATFIPAHRGGEGPPLLLIHGFCDTWRTWELVLERLERRHEVLAITLPGHAGGPPLPEPLTDAALIDATERILDEHGFGSGHIAGNSLGALIALQLAARGRAQTVTAFAPAGGWAMHDTSWRQLLDYQATMQEGAVAAAARAEELVSTRRGRRFLTATITTNFEHIPPRVLVNQLRAAAACAGAARMIAHARTGGWQLDAERIECPVRIVWGTADKLLPWPGAAARYRREWLPVADYVELSGIGHCPQLDVPLETCELITGFTGAGAARR